MKKEDYDIRFKIPDLSDDAINKHKDFDALLSQLEKEKTPAKRVSIRPWIYTGSAIAAALIGVMWFMPGIMTHEAEKGNGNTEFADLNGMNFLEAPIEKAQVMWVAHQISSSNEKELQISDDAYLYVPATAFVDENGNEVKGDFDIKYRNINDFGEYFMANVPMYYDSLDSRYLLSSAHMFEVYAEQEGKPLRLKDDKPLKIRFRENVNTAPSSFKVYKWNDKENWQYYSNTKYKNIINQENNLNENNATSQINNINQKYAQQLKVLNDEFNTLQLPQPPIPRDPNKTYYGLDVNNVGDLADYVDLQWDLKGTEEQLNVIRKIGDWDDLQVEKINKFLYKMTFIQGDLKVSLNAEPILSSADFQRAQSQYQNDLNSYNSQKEELTKKISDIETQRDEELNSINVEDGNSNDNITNIVEKSIEHVFTINELGLWTCHHLKLESKNTIQVYLEDERGNKLTNKIAYLANLDDYTLTKITVKNSAELIYNHNAKNQLWLINDEGKLAVAYPETFKNISLDVEKIIITLQTQDKTIQNVEDVYKVLKLFKKI